MPLITPCDKTTVRTIASFEAFITDLVFNTSATFRVSLYDENESCIENTYIIMEGQDYLDWGINDDYVIKFVATKLGFTLV